MCPNEQNAAGVVQRSTPAAMLNSFGVSKKSTQNHFSLLMEVGRKMDERMIAKQMIAKRWLKPPATNIPVLN
ncbi:MAG TPA: hypothetical protein VHY08_15025 [Bacillota bacterium]|nr:hypothetical protein [Bacillota bacterium]